MRIDPVAFTVLGKDIYWYGVIIAISIVVALFFIYKEMKKYKLSFDALIDLTLWCLPLAVICGRLYYVALHYNHYAGDPLSILYVWQGGIALYGVLFGGLLGVFAFSRSSHTNWVMWTDIILPGVLIAQAIGRWGNFINQEAYGWVITRPALQWFPLAVYIHDTQSYHMALFLYECVWNAAGFLFIYLLRKKKDLPTGAVTCLYMIIYGLIRSILENFRMDIQILYIGKLPVKITLVLSILLVVGAFVWLYFIYRKRARDHAVLDSSLHLDAAPIEEEPETAVSAEEPVADSEAPEMSAEPEEEEEEPEDFDLILGEEAARDLSEDER